MGRSHGTYRTRLLKFGFWDNYFPYCDLKGVLTKYLTFEPLTSIKSQVDHSCQLLCTGRIQYTCNLDLCFNHFVYYGSFLWTPFIKRCLLSSTLMEFMFWAVLCSNASKVSNYGNSLTQTSCARVRAMHWDTLFFIYLGWSSCVQTKTYTAIVFSYLKRSI